MATWLRFDELPLLEDGSGARWAGGGWASAESTLWDEAGLLVEYETHMIHFTYLSA